MRRREFLPMAAAPVLQAQRRRPNILFITADDLGLQLSCYGETRIATPNMDRLAASGVRFTTAYVAQASCSPSRSAMFTGLFPHANGQYGLANGGFALHEHLRAATIPNVLKKAGYRTGIIGKLHVEPESSFAFDYAQKDNALTRKVREVAPLASRFFQDSEDTPFFLMVNFSDPHAFRKPDNRSDWFFPPQVDGIPERPVPVSKEMLFPFQPLDAPEQRERTTGYYNAVQRLDHGMGLLMEALQTSGQADNTLVIFCGDHGPPFDRGKTTCYEGGLRIPFVVRWPGVSKPFVSRAMVSTTDIAPTIFDAAGVQSPVKTHGHSLRAFVADPSARGPEYLAGEFHFHGANIFFPRRAIRDERYKLIHNLRAGSARPMTGIDADKAYRLSREPQYAATEAARVLAVYADPPEFELYDLQADPWELRNLSEEAKLASVRQRLTGALLAWRKRTGDPFLDPAMIRKFAAYKPPRPPC